MLVPQEIPNTYLVRGKPQDIFDRVVSHLAKQGRPAYHSQGGCLYRTPEGLSCAIGCLIPDSVYKFSMEGMSVLGLIESEYIKIESDDAVELICALQSAHDTQQSKDDLINRLTHIACEFSLNSSAVRSITTWIVPHCGETVQ